MLCKYLWYLTNQLLIKPRENQVTNALDNIYAFNEIEKNDTQTMEHTMLDGAICWQDVPGKGRGIFARRLIKKDEVIEVSPVIPMGKHNIPDDGGPPDGYVLEWRNDTPGEEHALVLGYVMFYNHAENGNLYLESDFDNNLVTVTATRDIQAGEELLWNYSCELWFDPV